MKLLIPILALTLSQTACSSQKDQNNQDPIKEISVSEFNDLSKVNNTVILDVRTLNEFKEGHIDNAINIDFFDTNFNENIKKLDQSKNYLIYCKSGFRSHKSAEMMRKIGFKYIYDLKGGFINFSKQK